MSNRFPLGGRRRRSTFRERDHVLRPLTVQPTDTVADRLKDTRVGEVTDRDARICRRDADARAEWGRMVFYRCDWMQVIAREGDDGLHGWQYANATDHSVAWRDIEAVARRLAAASEGDYWERDDA